MNKMNLILEVLGKLFGWIKGISCKTKSCCGCESECGKKKSADSIEDAESDEIVEREQTAV
tara:strand:+ start:1616 stop:1798 length:183 start_codon:yes stop_codon:yes gene_type:complete